MLQNSFKIDPRYRIMWTQMCYAATKDAKYHCSLTSKALRVTIFQGFQNLVIPDTDSTSYKLSIPSLAFVATKMYKSFEVKLDRVRRRYLNFSHAASWVSYVHEINDHIFGRVSGPALQILDPGSYVFSRSLKSLLPSDFTPSVRMTTLPTLSTLPTTSTTMLLLTSSRTDVPERTGILNRTPSPSYTLHPDAFLPLTSSNHQKQFIFPPVYTSSHQYFYISITTRPIRYRCPFLPLHGVHPFIKKVAKMFTLCDPSLYMFLFLMS